MFIAPGCVITSGGRSNRAITGRISQKHLLSKLAALRQRLPLARPFGVLALNSVLRLGIAGVFGISVVVVLFNSNAVNVRVPFCKMSE